jgi:hypothetical protein
MAVDFDFSTLDLVGNDVIATECKKRCGGNVASALT